MLAFLFKVWGLARPYRTRLFLGVLTGIISGLTAPLMIGAIMFVYGAVFPSEGPDASAQLPIRGLPAFVQEWFFNVRAALEGGLRTHPAAVPALIAVFLLVVFLRGLFGYLNVYFLQWTASRAIWGMAKASSACYLKWRPGSVRHRPSCCA